MLNITVSCLNAYKHYCQQDSAGTLNYGGSSPPPTVTWKMVSGMCRGIGKITGSYLQHERFKILQTICCNKNILHSGLYKTDKRANIHPKVSGKFPPNSEGDSILTKEIP